VLRRRDLSAAAKLLYATIVDRIGGNGAAWPGMRRLAADCGVPPSSVADAIVALERAGLIEVERVGAGVKPGGTTNRYRLPKALGGRALDTRAPEGRTEALGGRTQALDTRTQALGGRTEPEKGTRERNQRKEPEVYPRLFGGGDDGGTALSAAEQDPAEVIYAAYPRKVGRRKALAAIGRALKALAKRADVADPAAWLLQRVRTFAASPAGQAGEFTPHPTSWFNGGRYDDDPAEWQRTNNRNGRARDGPRGAAKLDERIEEVEYQPKAQEARNQ
jgi:hypothetical protein